VNGHQRRGKAARIRRMSLPTHAARPPIPAPPAAVRYVEVDRERDGQRLDNFLFNELKGAPRNLVYRVLRTGQVRVNQGRAKAGYRVRAGDRIRIPPLRLSLGQATDLPSPARLRDLEAAILYEDAHLLILSKPAGLAVHGGSGLSHGVIEAMRALRPGETALELVHRLDRDTSGCLLLAKRRSTLRRLHQLIRDGAMEKRYLALLAGDLGCIRVEVDAPLCKNTLQGGERVVRVDPQGKPSRTEFRRLRRLSGATLVEARLHTGRTHQIRVHAAHSGAPVLGDDKYGDREANAVFRALGLRRLFLHAYTLTFPLPEGQGTFEISAPLDPELQALLQRITMTE
jgi:23S rRNA pseudouridine955/2504/2580 synthase